MVHNHMLFMGIFFTDICIKKACVATVNIGFLRSNQKMKKKLQTVIKLRY